MRTLTLALLLSVLTGCSLLPAPKNVATFTLPTRDQVDVAWVTNNGRLWRCQVETQPTVWPICKEARWYPAVITSAQQ